MICTGCQCCGQRPCHGGCETAPIVVRHYRGPNERRARHVCRDEHACARTWSESRQTDPAAEKPRLIVPTGPPRDPHATGLINDEKTSET